MKELDEILNNEDIEINKIQYRLMLDTIGFVSEKIENNTFTMWKNILQKDKKLIDTDLIKLMSLGLGVLKEGKRTTNFLVSKKGVDLISNVEKCLINYNGFFDEGWKEY